MTIFHLDCEKNRYHYLAPSQQRSSVCNERIITYTNIYARTQIGDSCCYVRFRSRSHRKLYLDNFIRTYFIVSKRAMGSRQTASPEYVYFDLTVSKLNKSNKDVSTRITSNLKSNFYRSSTISFDVSIVVLVIAQQCHLK